MLNWLNYKNKRDVAMSSSDNMEIFPHESKDEYMLVVKDA